MKNNWVEVFFTALKLGLTSFGGPIAHLGYFRNEYVERKKWLDDKAYADLVAMCQFLPGPASSQVGIAIGTLRAGIPGGILAWIGFTLPSVLMLAVAALFFQQTSLPIDGMVHGLKIVAVAVVAHALLGMFKSLADTRMKKTIAIFSAIITLLWQTAISQFAVILLAAFIGWYFLKHEEPNLSPSAGLRLKGMRPLFWWVLFLALFAVLPLMRSVYPSLSAEMMDGFYRAGALVFGGGHVVLPLLEKEVVPTGWISREEFLTGYGLAQAVPGPLFTFAGYLGMLIAGWKGVAVAVLAIFLPSFLLVFGSLPYWERLRGNRTFRAMLAGVNASVVGILAAALYNPLWITGIQSTADLSLALFAFLMLAVWKIPPWAVVAVTAFGGYALNL